MKKALRAALEPAEGGVENAAGGWSEGKAFPLLFIKYSEVQQCNR